MPLVLCCLLALPHSASADNLQDIVFDDGSNGTVSSWEPGDDSEMSRVAEAREYGIYNMGDGTVGYGKLLSPFSLKTQSDVVSFSMSIPDEANEELGSLGYAFYIGVQSLDSSDPVMFYETTVEDDAVEVRIPIWGKEVNCALVQVMPESFANAQAASSIQSLRPTFPETILENAQGEKLPFTLSFSINEKAETDFDTILVPLTARDSLDLSIILSAQPGLVIDESSVEVTSTFFQMGDLTDLENGYWEITLEPKEEYYKDPLPPAGSACFTDEASKAIGETTTVTFDCKIAPGDFADGKTMYSLGAEVVATGGDFGIENTPYTVSSAVFDDSQITMKSAVTVSVVDMVSYEGGKEGYEGAVDPDGSSGEGSSSMPHPVFEIVPSKETPTVDPTDLTFSTEDGKKSWTVKAVETAEGVSGDTDATYYRFEPGAEQDPVRVTYTDKDGNTVLDDEFSPSSELFAEYIVSLYPGENAEDFSNIKVDAEDYDGILGISVNPGTLTVRAVDADNEGEVTSLVKDEVTSPVAPGKGEVVASSNTFYTLNDTNVKVPNDGIALLFDGIIDDEEVNRTEKLEEKVDATQGAVPEGYTRHYQAQFLDLVDVNNGNAWVKASEPVTVYWGYPEGTDKNTDFTLWHFDGLHRSGPSSGFDVSDLETITPEEINKLQQGDNGISFQVSEGNFSPFVLTWDVKDEVEEPDDPDTPVIPPTTRYTIDASAGEGGSISPSGKITVSAGQDKTFTITPDEGNKIMNVTIDGKAYGPLASYTFEDVRADHTIKVVFKAGNAPADPDDTGVSDWLNTKDHDVYLHGYQDGSNTFKPNGNMTRGEVACMFYNLLLDKSMGDTPVTFEDVPESAFYAEPIRVLASRGILFGTSPTTFAPDRPITRAEFTAIAMRFSKGDLSGENIFVDVAEGAWYYDVIVGSIKYGWIYGYQDGSHRFGPDDTITRAEATCIANRMLGRLPDGAYIAEHKDELRLFADVPEEHFAWRDIIEATNAHDYVKDGGYEDWTSLKDGADA